jgi:hypothetical protein
MSLEDGSIFSKPTSQINQHPQIILLAGREVEGRKLWINPLAIPLLILSTKIEGEDPKQTNL